MTSKVYVFGAGGHAKVVVRTLQLCRHDVAGIFDDDCELKGQSVCGVPILGPIEQAGKHPRHPAVIAIGCNRIRQTIAEQMQFDWLSAVHPHAFVDSTVSLGAGTVVMANSAVQPGSVLGNHVIVNTSASVDHDCQIEGFVHIGPGVRLSGGVIVRQGAFLGVGSVVIPLKEIGAWATVGAGGVVIDNVPANSTVVGVPAKRKDSSK